MLVKIVLLLMLFLGSLFGVEESKIESTMKQKMDSIVSILNDDDITNGQKKEKLYNLLDDVFDFELMARIALGRTNYAKLSEQQKEEFTKLFIDKLKKSYLDKIDLYNGQELLIQGVTKVKADRINLLTQIQGQNETYDLVYKFYPKSKDNWLIYDVDMVGISVIQTYIRQFNEFLATKTIDELIKSLK